MCQWLSAKYIQMWVAVLTSSIGTFFRFFHFDLEFSCSSTLQEMVIWINSPLKWHLFCGLGNTNWRFKRYLCVLNILLWLGEHLLSLQEDVWKVLEKKKNQPIFFVLSSGNSWKLLAVRSKHSKWFFDSVRRNKPEQKLALKLFL